MKDGCYTDDPCNSGYPMREEYHVSEIPFFVALLIELSMRAHPFAYTQDKF